MLRANLNEILVFMAVADEGSFIGGGNALGLTRSAAGKAITRLEDRLGVRLLNRTTRALSLTDEGRVFYERSQQILTAVDDAESSVMQGPGRPRGVLRITMPDAYGRLVILPLLQRYMQAWPDLQVDASFTDRATDIVEEGFDLAIRIGDAPPDTRLVARTISQCRTVLCAAPAYIAAHGALNSVDDLAQHQCLIFTNRNRRYAWRFLGSDGSWVKAHTRSRMRVDSGEAIRDAAVAGLGIAYLPRFLVDNHLAGGRLVQVLPALKLEQLNLVAIYPSRRLLEPRVRQFIDLMVRELDEG
jgi:DNA-binding transcriptional LysR family regulator